MLPYIYLIIAALLLIKSVQMISHKNRSLIRASGLVLAHFAGGIAMKAYYMLAILPK